MAKLYQINVPIIGYVTYETEAESIEEAKEIVAVGNGDYDGDIFYDEIPDKDKWEAEEIEDLGD